MSALSPIEYRARKLWQPNAEEQIAAAEIALCNGLHPEARKAAKQRLQDYLAHARGCRRRAHEYKRWALEYEQAGNLENYRKYRDQSDRSWRLAKGALERARCEFNTVFGER